MTESTRHEDASWLGLAGSVCVVTGAASGIGAETARQFAAAGASVAILDLDADGAVRVAREIERLGGRAIGIGTDVAQVDSVAAAAADVARMLGPCRVLVNNAAVLSTELLTKLGRADWDRVLAVNLTGALECAQQFTQQMIATGHGGSIVNVASIAGTNPMPRNGAYSISKAGLMMLSRVLSLELAEHHIRSNVVAPAMVRTPFSESGYRDPEVVRQREAMVPLGRIGTPLDLAYAILFLASDRASYVTGQEILVDGALSQTLMGLVPGSARKTQT